EFAFLLNTLDENGEISRSREEAQQLRREADDLRQQAEAIKRLRDEAERAYIAGQFGEAEQLLGAIEHNAKLKDLRQLVEALGIRIAGARERQARSQLDELLTQARIALRTDAVVATLDALIASLEQARQRLDWAALNNADRGELQD